MIETRFTRRKILKTLAAAGGGALAVGFYTWRIEPHWLELTHRELPIARLPRELEGRALAQLSDLHIGPKVDDAYIIESFRRVRELAPDFVVYTGDWITFRGPGQFEQLRRVIEHAPHGRLATVGILGNHDYGFNGGCGGTNNRDCSRGGCDLIAESSSDSCRVAVYWLG